MIALLTKLLSRYRRGVSYLLYAIVAIAFTWIQITYSLQHGKLALIPEYDDIAYLLEGANLLNIVLQNGIQGFLTSPIPHSPVSVYTAFFGFLVFGFHTWSPYAINSIYVFLLLIGLDYLGKYLPFYQRFLLSLTSLTYPIVANLVMEFRPDILCSLVTAYGAMMCLQANFNQPKRRDSILIGSMWGFALLCKPSMFPMTTLLMTCSILLPCLSKLEHNNFLKSGKLLFKFYGKCLGIALILGAPYYIFGGLSHSLEYIQIVMFGDNREIWVPKFSPATSRAYYLTGRGGVMMGSWFFTAVLAYVGILLECGFRKKWDKIKVIASAIGIFIVAYISVTIPAVKSPFLGLIVTSLILFYAYKILIYGLQSLSLFLGSVKIRPHLRSSLIITILISTTYFHWITFPYQGGGSYLFSNNEVRMKSERLNTIFKGVSSLLSKSNENRESSGKDEKIFLTTNLNWVNPHSLNLAVQFSKILHLNVMGIDLNHDKIGSSDTYINYIQKADYVMLPTGKNVQYSSFRDPKQSPIIKNSVEKFIQNSREFRKIDEYESPSGDGTIELYKRIHPKS